MIIGTCAAPLEAQAGLTEKRIDRIEATLARILDAIGELHADNRLLRAEMALGRAETKADLETFCAEIKSDIAALPTEAEMRGYLISGLILSVAVFGLILAGTTFLAPLRSAALTQPIVIQLPPPVPTVTTAAQ